MPSITLASTGCVGCGGGSLEANPWSASYQCTKCGVVYAFAYYNSNHTTASWSNAFTAYAEGPTMTVGRANALNNKTA